VNRSEELADESRLLGRIRKALDAGDFEAALDWAEEHARRHPDGALSEERLILEAVAACRGGRLDRGRACLASLRQRYPGTPAITPVEQACE
jgi:outer membrane protein assembly factor BamD (BamD/ComL family)